VSWSEEDKLMLYCSRMDMDGDIDLGVQEILHSDLNWGYVLKEALANGVSPLLYRNLKRINGDSITPDEVIEELREIYFNTAASNIILLDGLGKVLKAFADEEIPVMVLKGAALLETVYRDIGLRPMADIDLLIKKEDLGRIDESLKRLGYSSPYNWSDYMDISTNLYLNTISYIRGQDTIPIHLHPHWHIINTTVPTYTYGAKIEMDRFWLEAREAMIAGVSSLTMAPHHLLMHLSEHILRHSYDRSILFCDIFEVINNYKDEIDWGSLIDDAVEFNLKKPVYYALYFTSKFLGAEIPKNVLAELKQLNLNYGERKVEALISKNRSFPELKYLIYLVMNERVTERIRFVWRSLFPPREMMAQRHALSTSEVSLFHYLLRMRNTFKKGLRVFTYLFKTFVLFF